MKTRKVNFSELENNMKREEKRNILGGGANTLDQLGPSDDMDFDYSSGGGFGMTGFGQGSFVSGSANNFSQLGSYGSSSYNNSSYTGGSYGGGSYGGSSSGSNYNAGWSFDSNGITTNDPYAIDRYLTFAFKNNGILSGDQTLAFILNEGTFEGQQQNNIQLYGTVLNNVNVQNNYKGPSTIVQGANYENGVLKLDTTIGSGGYQVQTVSIKSDGGSTDCVFQCMAQIGSLYGKTANYSFEEMKAKYDSIYNTSTVPGAVAPATMGVDQVLLSNFVDQYFNRVPITTINELDKFITAGGDNFAIGIIRKYGVNGTSTLHAVVLTMAEGNVYKYTDPQNGGVVEEVQKNNLVGVAAITGVCQ